MKTTINKSVIKKTKGEYSSVDEFVQAKLERATQTLKKVDLSKIPKFAE